MSTKNDYFVQPHLNFDGRCEEAIEFYQKAIGAEVAMMFRFKDSPDKSMCTPTSPDKIMHARIRIGETLIQVSDGRCQGKETFSGFALSITVHSEAEVEQLCNGLATGGQVVMPPAKTFFSERFGMVTDKFGVSWMILVKPASM
jgi:PhnB protein